jgi:hypothetical protein
VEIVRTGIINGCGNRYSAGVGEEVRTQRLELSVDGSRDRGVEDEAVLAGPVSGEHGEGVVEGEGSSHCDCGDEVR